MIQKISGYWLHQLEKQQLLKYDKEIYQYGLEVIISTLIDFILIMFVGYLFHQPIDSFIFYISFALIRKFCGGFHFDTYTPCILTHTGICFIYFMISPYIDKNISIIVVFVSWIIFFKYVPVVHQNRQLDKEEQKRNRYIAMLILLGYCLFMMTPIRKIITYTIISVCILIMICIKNYEK